MTPKPFILEDNDGQSWLAIGLVPGTRDLLWVPADTPIIAAPLFEEDDEQEAEAPTTEPADQLVLPLGVEREEA